MPDGAIEKFIEEVRKAMQDGRITIFELLRIIARLIAVINEFFGSLDKRFNGISQSELKNNQHKIELV